MGGAFGVPGNTTPTTEWNIHCDPGGGEDRASRLVGATRPTRRPAAARARARRDRAGADPARPRRPRSPGAPAARRTTRSRWPRRGPDARRARSPATRSSATSPTRCASTWSSTPLRRLLRRVHPRSAGRRGGARPRASCRPRRCPSTSRLAGDADRPAMTVADWRRVCGQAAEPRRRGRAAMRPTFLDRFIERVGGLAADRSDVAR